MTPFLTVPPRNPFAPFKKFGEPIFWASCLRTSLASFPVSFAVGSVPVRFQLPTKCLARSRPAGHKDVLITQTKPNWWSFFLLPANMVCLVQNYCTIKSKCMLNAFGFLECLLNKQFPCLLLLTKSTVRSNLGLELAGLTHEPYQAECVKVRGSLRSLPPRSGAAESLVQKLRHQRHLVNLENESETGFYCVICQNGKGGRYINWVPEESNHTRPCLTPAVL